MFRLILSFIFFSIVFLQPLYACASHLSDPTVSLLKSKISKNFSRKFCNAIQNGLSKDEAMTSAIIKTENILSFSYNPQKKWIEKEDLANQISIKVINECGWSFGLNGKEGINYFKSYFLEIYDKTTPEKKLSS